MNKDFIRTLRRFARRDYLRRHEQERRAADRSAGARRIDVTLRGKMLDDFAVVRRWVEGFNRVMVARNVPRLRLSDTQIIRTALSYAASAMEEEDWEQAKFGKVRFLDDDDEDDEPEADNGTSQT